MQDGNENVSKDQSWRTENKRVSKNYQGILGKI